MEIKPITLIDVLRPVLRAGQVIGVCPHLIEGDLLVFKWKSFLVYRTILTLLILASYFLFVSYQFVVTLSNGKNIMEIVKVVCWLNGSLIPLVMICIVFRKRYKMTLFFQKIGEYKQALKGVLKCQANCLKYSRKLCGIYLFFTAISCGLTYWDVFYNPYDSYLILQYYPRFFGLDENIRPPYYLVVIQCIFQCYLVATIRNIEKELVLTLDVSRLYLYRSNCLSSKQIRQNNISSLSQNQDKKEKIYNPYEPVDYSIIDMRRNSGSKNGLSMRPNTAGGFRMRNDGDQERDCSSAEGSETRAILLAIRRFHCVHNIQSLVNCIFGHLLALSTALLVILTCLHLFYVIKYIGKTDVNSLVSGFEVIMTAVNTTGLLIRLLIIFINLGNVHQASEKFNDLIAKSLLQCRKPQVCDVNLILAHLSSNMPLAFSAGAFFTFSRGSLLAVISIITTYLVFLLQA